MKNTKRIAAIVMALAFALVSVTAAPDVALAKTSYSTVKVRVKYGQTDARRIQGMVNTFRTGKDAWYWNENNKKKVRVKGLKKLKYDYGLEKAAMQRAAEIAVNYDHTRPDGRTCFTVFDDLKYKKTGARGENIAYGYTSASKANKAWREDDEKYNGQGHRRNMLGVPYSFSYIGIAHVVVDGTDFWVEEFSSKSTGVKKTKAANGNRSVRIKVPKNRIVTVRRKKYVESNAETWDMDAQEFVNVLVPLD